MEVWVQYAELAEKAGRHSMASTLLARKPILKENFLIELCIDNQVQENEMRAERTELLTYLRSRLNNYKIDIETSIKLMPAEERKYFTQKEKFYRLAELYPVLNKLKQQLDLDID
jgi:DNA polymerase-3 subunit gamma/tau